MDRLVRQIVRHLDWGAARLNPFLARRLRNIRVSALTWLPDRTGMQPESSAEKAIRLRSTVAPRVSGGRG